MGVIRQSPGRRVQSWLYTGPVGHLWSVVADVVVFALRWRRRTEVSEARDGR